MVLPLAVLLPVPLYVTVASNTGCDEASSRLPLMPLLAVSDFAVAAFPAVTITVCGAGEVYARSLLATVYVPGETPLNV